MLTRISEIIHALEPIQEGEAFFEFWASFESEPIIKKVFQDVERHLGDVDEGQWKLLLPKVVKKFKSRDQYRGWHQAFDALQEGIACSFLKRDGFSDIEFLPRRKNRKTPDLIATRGRVQVAIEVKSINPSADEVNARKSGTARPSGVPLNEKFLQKLQSTLEKAAQQLAAQECDERVIFLFIEFDDLSNEYVANDLAQITSWLGTHIMVADRYYIHCHPACYYASAQSVPPHLIVWPQANVGVVEAT
jgi:hypothetical protein